MVATDRALSRAAERARRARLELGYEVRHARLAAGLSQREVGRRLAWSGVKVCRIENGKLTALSFEDASRLAAVLGLELSIRVFPGGQPIRDAAQTKRLLDFLRNVQRPLTWRTDVPLPQRDTAWRELRAWDANIVGSGERTSIEYESRLSDVQELTRRHNLKRRDDPPDHFLLVVAATEHNRRVLREFGHLFGDLPRLRAAAVLSTLREGRHPPTGVVLLSAS